SRSSVEAFAHRSIQEWPVINRNVATNRPDRFRYEAAAGARPFFNSSGSNSANHLSQCSNTHGTVARIGYFKASSSMYWTASNGVSVGCSSQYVTMGVAAVSTPSPNSSDFFAASASMDKRAPSRNPLLHQPRAKRNDFLFTGSPFSIS